MSAQQQPAPKQAPKRKSFLRNLMTALSYWAHFQRSCYQGQDGNIAGGKQASFQEEGILIDLA